MKPTNAVFGAGGANFDRSSVSPAAARISASSRSAAASTPKTRSSDGSVTSTPVALNLRYVFRPTTCRADSQSAGCISLNHIARGQYS